MALAISLIVSKKVFLSVISSGILDKILLRLALFLLSSCKNKDDSHIPFLTWLNHEMKKRVKSSETDKFKNTFVLFYCLLSYILQHLGCPKMFLKEVSEISDQCQWTPVTWKGSSVLLLLYSRLSWSLTLPWSLKMASFMLTLRSALWTSLITRSYVNPGWVCST